MKKRNIFLDGIVFSNPILVLALGLCSAMAQTTTFENAFYLGVATALVVIITNVLISLLRKVIPDKIRIPAYIMVIATLVTLVQMLLKRFLPDVNDAIGTSISMIVVNCVVLARAEAFASKNKVLDSLIDGVGMGLGFVLVLCIIGGLRELLTMAGIAVFAETAGGFLVLATVMGVFNFVSTLIKNRRRKNGIAKKTTEEVPQ